MAERVGVREGGIPIVCVAPHGLDDLHTDIIVEEISESLDCYAVINYGWKRSDAVDAQNDKANCNSISHCYEPVVKDEFLDPLLRYAHRSRRIAQSQVGVFLSSPLMITIHGVGKSFPTSLGKFPDMILGYGAGKPTRPSIQMWKKEALAYMILDKGVNVFEGRAGGLFTAWGKDNINQLFNQKYPGLSESIQIEIVKTPWRDNEKHARATGSLLADILRKLIKMNDFSAFKSSLGLPSC